MRVITTKTLNEVENELFGDIQEASRQQHPLGIDPLSTWCDLSELRLSMLLVNYKPIGLNRNMHKVALIDRMNAVLDDEEPTAEMFLKDEDIPAFRQQQEELISGNRPERISFQPKYTLRPSIQCLDAKLKTWFGMETCEKNESAPATIVEAREFLLPGYLFPSETEMNGNESNNHEATTPKTNGHRKSAQRNRTETSTPATTSRKRKGAAQEN